MHREAKQLGFLAMCLGVVSVVLLFAATARCTDDKPNPNVNFDASYTIECRDVTPKPASEKAPAPTCKIIEATFRFSVDIDGDESKVKGVVFIVDSVDKTLRVKDTLETTTLVPRAKGPILVQKRRASSSSEEESKPQGRLSIIVPPVVGEVRSKFTKTASSSEDVTEEKYERESPKDAALIVTTIRREHGVQFKLKPTEQHTFQGIKEFTIRFEAPVSWRGDWVKVECEAHDAEGSKGEKFGEWGLAIGLHLKGEPSARKNAEDLADTQADLDAVRRKGEDPDEAIRSRYNHTLRSMKAHSR